MKPAMDEVDVFTGPHSRMRILLDRMRVRLANTDFRNRNSVATLLFELQYIFSEFKKHEEIEDTYIVDELKLRMIQGAVDKESECVGGDGSSPSPMALEKDLHGDDRLSSVIHIIANVQDVTRRDTCNRVIRLRQGQRLCEVLDEFTIDFVPHMDEEEQVFQPLLLRHFSALELIGLRDKVLQLHSSHVRATTSVVSGPLSVQAWWSRGLPAPPTRDDPQEPRDQKPAGAAASVQYKSTTTIDSLPCEILLGVFKLIDDVPTLLRASQVCRYWNTLAFDGMLWRSVYLRRWFLGNWHFSTPMSYGDYSDQSDEEDDEVEDSGEEEHERKETLDDYDVDGESMGAARGTKALWSEGRMTTRHTAEEEKRFLDHVCLHLLPKVGRHVRLLSFHGSTSLTNDMLRRFLYRCPNIEHLSIAYTNVSTFGLDSRLHRKLNRLSASACANILDVSIQSLAQCLKSSASALRRDPSDSSGKFADSTPGSCNHSPEHSAESSPLCGGRRDARPGPRLWYLDLSGCHNLTDKAIEHLMACGPFPDLIHLDLSGMSKISGQAVKQLVARCPSLKPERFYYCERIPHDEDYVMKTAEMCRGICHKGITCCRFSS